MKISEIIGELESIRLQLRRLRLKNRRSAWLCHLLQANEIITAATIKTLQHVAQSYS